MMYMSVCTGYVYGSTVAHEGKKNWVSRKLAVLSCPTWVLSVCKISRQHLMAKPSPQTLFGVLLNQYENNTYRIHIKINLDEISTSLHKHLEVPGNELNMLTPIENISQDIRLHFYRS